MSNPPFWESDYRLSHRANSPSHALPVSPDSVVLTNHGSSIQATRSAENSTKESWGGGGGTEDGSDAGVIAATYLSSSL